MIPHELPVAMLSKPAQKIARQLDEYIQAMQMTQRRMPTAAWVSRAQAETLQRALDRLAERGGERMRLADLTYRGLPFRVT